MDASELLRGDDPFVADTSAWWRLAALPSELGGLVKDALLDGRWWITPIVRMEILYSARSSAEYLALAMELDALRILRSDRIVADAAMTAIGELAESGDGFHRVPLTDALIAAAAAEHGGVAVLHRDGHFRSARGGCWALGASRCQEPDPPRCARRPCSHAVKPASANMSVPPPTVRPE